MIAVKNFIGGKGAKIIRPTNSVRVRRKRSEQVRIDKDVMAYYAKGATTRPTRTGIEALDQFARQVKKLGLWENMISWPGIVYTSSRKSTTVHSLGGWQTSNGTANSLALFTDSTGFAFIDTGTLRIITATVSGKNGMTDFHCVCAVRQTTLPARISRIVFFDPWSFDIQSSSSTVQLSRGTGVTVNSTISDTDFKIFQMGQSGNTMRLGTGGSFSTYTHPDAVALSGNDINLGGHPTNSPVETLRGRMAFCAFFNKSLTSEEAMALDQILRTTLLKTLRIA
jgi:hypothetical protein